MAVEPLELLALESADEVEGLLLIPIPPFRLKLTSKEILLVWTVSGWLNKRSGHSINPNLFAFS